MNHYGNYPMPPREAIAAAYQKGLLGVANTLFANPWLAKSFLGGIRRATGLDWMMSVVGTQNGIYYGVETVERK